MTFINDSDKFLNAYCSLLNASAAIEFVEE